MNQIITLTSGQTSLDLWTFGARINAVSFDGSANLLDGSNTIAEAGGDKLNHGSICGPVANRIAGATAEIDGTSHEFERNENGVTLLHSGSKSTRDSIWSVVSTTGDSAVLGIDIADGADDFPGNRRIETSVRVFDNVLCRELPAV